MNSPVQNSFSIPSAQDVKTGRLCLSILAGRKVIHLNPKNFDSPLSTIFPANPLQPFPLDAQPLIGRLKPVLELSPHQLLESDLDFLKSQVPGISSNKIFREAFEIRLITLALQNPNCPSLILLHKISHDLPLLDEDWKSFSADIKRFYGLLPLIGDLEIGQLFPESPLLNEEWTNRQLKQAWDLWSSYFSGLMSCQKQLYLNMTQLALDLNRNKQNHFSVKKSEMSIYRKVPLNILKSLFWEEPLSFLSKHEQLKRFQKKLTFIKEQIHLFKNDPVLFQAAIFDCVNSTLGLITDISKIAQSMENTFVKHKKNKEVRVFADKSLKLELRDPAKIQLAHDEAIENWHFVFLNASVLSLFSHHFCKIVRKSLNQEESKGGKLLPQSERALRAKVAYHSLALEDFDSLPPSKEKKKENLFLLQTSLIQMKKSLIQNKK